MKILKALFWEHSFLTIFRLNFHKVDKNFYRSAQPNPWQLKKIIEKYPFRERGGFNRKYYFGEGKK